MIINPPPPERVVFKINSGFIQTAGVKMNHCFNCSFYESYREFTQSRDLRWKLSMRGMDYYHSQVINIIHEVRHAAQILSYRLGNEKGKLYHFGIDLAKSSRNQQQMCFNLWSNKITFIVKLIKLITSEKEIANYTAK